MKENHQANILGFSSQVVLLNAPPYLRYFPILFRWIAMRPFILKDTLWQVWLKMAGVLESTMNKFRSEKRTRDLISDELV